MLWLELTSESILGEEVHIMFEGMKSKSREDEKWQKQDEKQWDYTVVFLVMQTDSST